MNRTAPHTASHPTVVAIVGPTAVGKTALAEELALRYGGELVSADSMQVYRGMDVGTAKPSQADRIVPYHCIDIADPGEPFSAALFQSAARAAIDNCHSRGVLPVLSGGTGLYVRAALDPMEFPAGEQQRNDVRRRLEALAVELGADRLHDLLAAQDAESAALIHPNNVRRVVRALEMAESGISYAEHHAGFSRRESIYDARILGLTMDREMLYRRVRERVDVMMGTGLLEEVERLLEAGFRDALTAAQAIGYKELVGVVDGSAALHDAIAAIKVASTRYAKRQLTWFRSDPRIVWLDVTELELAAQVDAAVDALHLHGRDTQGGH